jgi:hypothetical protein
MHGGFNNFGYPAREMSTNLNGEHIIGQSLQPNLVQYTPKQQNKNMIGQTEFEFSMSPGAEFIPAKSYFLMNIKVVVANGAGGTRAPIKGDNICLSNLVGGQIFQDVYFDMANRNISKQTTEQAHAYALYNRMSYGGGFLENNKDIFYYYPNIGDRINDLCNGDDLSSCLAPSTPSAPVDITNDANGINITVTGADISEPNGGLLIGDVIVYNTGGVYKTYTVVKFISEQQVIVTGPAQVDLLNITQNKFSVIRKRKSDNYKSCGQKLIAYQPPMGIFQLTSGITCSNMRIALNPNSQW